MPRTLQFKRYGSATLANTIGANGELIINQTNKTLTVHDGTTPGGFALLNAATDFDIDQTARNQANTASNNITIIQGVNVTQNTNITNATNLAQAAYNYANTIVSDTQIDPYARTTANSASNNITIIQGVNDTQNTRLNSIETINTNQNTSISIIQGVDNTQNTNITTANNAAWAAFTKANNALANTTGTFAGNLNVDGFITLNTAGGIYQETASPSIMTANTTGIFKIVTNRTIDPYTWTFAQNGNTTFPTGVRLSNARGPNTVNFTADVDKSFQIETGTASVSKLWNFQTNGNLTLPQSGTLTFSDNTIQNTAYVPVTGSWTVTTGTNTYSFTVPSDGTYTMWVKGNIANGIIIWNATLSISNSNVPAIGTQYAWNYTSGGSPILLTTLPDQIRGTANTISTDNTYVGSTSNRFDFGISNSSGSSQTIYYGYTKI
jgi:hypothetical protein